MDEIIWFFLLSAISAAVAITLGMSLFADCLIEKRKSKASHKEV